MYGGTGLRRTMGRRSFLRLLALTGGAAALAACAPAPGAAPAAPAAKEAGFQGTIEFWDWAYEPRMAFMEELVKSWEEAHPGVTLKYNPLDWTEIETKILTVATAGTGPAFSNIHFFWRYDLQRAGILTPYPDDIFDWDDLISTPFNRDPETGEIYTCDFCYYADAVYYNRELLEAEGIKETEIPRKWDDFIKMAQQLTKRDASGKIVQVGLSLNDYWAREWLWMDLVYQQGGWLYNEEGTEALWNREEGVRALQFIKDIYHTWKVDDPEFLSQGDAFGNGKAAFYINQGYTAPGIDSSFPQMQGKWATAVEPTFTGGPLPSWGLQVPEEGFCVFNKFPVEVRALAFDFIKHMIGSDEHRVKWALVMLGPPDAKHLLNHPDIMGNNVIATQAETLPYRVNYGERPLEAEKFWRAMFDEVILEGKEPKEALDKATEQMNAAFKESGKRRYIVERNYRPPAA
ncbi:MAG: extracellular solute-binding protein [Anaerolineae bacterium]|nr:extracellular solute-binding protein [Anaerolineae bacterium]MDW8100563.1 extracellular solute-binding protein [Anaerolineae bacterium]